MSMSLPNDPAGMPKCSRCRHHGIIVPKKGHTKTCPLLKCQCWKCYLITERTKIAAKQREMKRAKKELRPRARRVNEQGDEAVRTSNPDEGAPSTSEPMCPPPGGGRAEGLTADPRSRPQPGGETESGLDSSNVLPSAVGEFTPLNLPFFSQFRQMAPLPLIHFPVRMPGYYPRSFSSPSPQFLPSMPWLHPVPFGYLYPSPQQPGPPADCRGPFFSHQPLPELMPRQHPPPPALGATEQEDAEEDEL